MWCHTSGTEDRTDSPSRATICGVGKHSQQLLEATEGNKESSKSIQMLSKGQNNTTGFMKVNVKKKLKRGDWQRW